MIIYDILHDEWLIDDHVLNDDETPKYTQTGTYVNGQGYVMSITGVIYQDEYNYSLAVPVEYRTPKLTFGAPAMKKILDETRTIISLSANASVTQEMYAETYEGGSSDMLKDSTTVTGSDSWVDFTAGDLQKIPQGSFPIGGELSGGDFTGAWNTRQVIMVNTTGKAKSR